MSAGADPPLYEFGGARSAEQRGRMEALADAGVCIFCPEHVGKHHPEPVEISGEHWYVTRNAYPYAGTAEHFLIVARRHVTAFDALPDAAGAELWALKRQLAERLRPLATATVERSGDMTLNGGTIAHLHVHFVALAREPEVTVRFRVSARAAGE